MADGKIPIGSTGSGFAAWTTITPGVGITVTPSSNAITITTAGTVPTTFTEDVGSAAPALGNLNMLGAHGINTLGAGSTVTTAINNTITLGDLSVVAAGSPSLTLTTGDLTLSGTGATGANINLPATSASGAKGVLFIGARFAHTGNAAVENTFIGNDSGNFTLTGISNTGVGQGVLVSLTTGIQNTVIGVGAGQAITTGTRNVLAGWRTFVVGTSGSNNSIIGDSFAGGGAFNGSNNVMLQAGLSLGQCLYTGTESSNVLIENVGVAAESNVMRLGTTGSGTGQQNRAFIAGVDGVNVGSVAKVLTMASEQVGTAQITAGANVSVTATANAITIAANTGASTIPFRSVNNAASPYTVDSISPDYYISANVTAGVITIRLPNAPTTARVFVVKDAVGLAAASNITVTTVGGTVLIDGATSFVMNSAYQAAQFIFTGTAYEIY